MSNPDIYKVGRRAIHLLVGHKTLRREAEETLLRCYAGETRGVCDHDILALNMYFEPNTNTLRIFGYAFTPPGYYSSTEVIE